MRKLTALALLIPALALPLSAALKVRETAAEIRVANADATLVIEKNPWRMSLLSPDGTVQFSEATPPAFKINDQWQPIASVRTDKSASTGQSVQLSLALANKTPVTATITPVGAAGFHVVITPQKTATAICGSAVLDMVEELYGFGEMWNGRVAQRGAAFDLWNTSGTPDECAYMPYYVSTRNYAFFLDYGGRVSFDVGRRRADRLTYEAPAGEIDITLVRGASIADTVRAFFTAKDMLPKQPPRWTFQPWVWLMGDPGTPGAKIDTLRGHHFIEMVQKLHALEIPVGTTWLEPPWMTARTTFIADPKFDPDLKSTVAKLREMGVRTLAWTVPYTLPDASNYPEAVAKGYFVQKPDGLLEIPATDNTITSSGELLVAKRYNFIDLFNPDAFEWWKQQIAASVRNYGIVGYKIDAGQDLETDARLHGNRLGADVHNSYALEYNRVFAEALQQELGDDYLMIPRAGWVGSSKYHNFKWPGDLSGSYASNGLPSSIYSSLSLAFCANPFVSTDIGGFEDQPAGEKYWIRWAQFGAFLPGMQTLHMPWWYSKESQDHYRFLSWLHNDMIPFWQSLAHEASRTAAPIVRPLVWTWQDDVDCWRVDDQFTVGDALLLAPVITSEFNRTVYFPEGEWHDFWDEARVVTGPSKINWFEGWFRYDRFPLYIRAGAIIPMEISNAHSTIAWPEAAGYVTLAIWPKANAASGFTLHDTEAPVKITADATAKNTLKISWTKTVRNHLLRIHLPAAPANVKGIQKSNTLTAFRATTADAWFYDESTHKLWIRKANNNAPATVEVRLR